ncbi:MAG: trehalase-like domain-containing protein [Terracidiphilus sp.]
MSKAIGDYGMIGDLRTAALISATGRRWPDFDSQARFASLLGDDANGSWTLGPKTSGDSIRSYLPGTLVLETTFIQTGGARVTLTDFMPFGTQHSSVVRIVRGVAGLSRMQTCFAPRFDYGHAAPRLEKLPDQTWTAVTGPHRLALRSNVPLRCEKGDIAAEWLAEEGDTYFFTLQHSNSYLQPLPTPIDAEETERETVAYWKEWIARSGYRGSYREAVERSMLTLKGLTSGASGGFVAAPTTSLPEKVGGKRNWDYRFCWLRDAPLRCGCVRRIRSGIAHGFLVSKL